MSESIYFYKLVSPYTEDITLDCKLTMSQMDHNFLTFKDYDVKTASYDSDSMELSVTRNNGDVIVVDLSGIRDEIVKRIEEATSGLTPESGSTIEGLSISGELSDDGILTLTLSGESGDTSTTISGFLTESQLRHDETLSGDSSEDNPLRISSLERTGRYKSVLGIIDELPSQGLSVGDRYITKHSVSSFGRMYNKQGIELVKNALSSENSLWRIPTKEDWNKLLNYADLCEDNMHDVDTVGEYLGNVAGKVLKSVDYWEGNENLDTFGFGVVPAGYVSDDMLEGPGTDARFWTDTDYDSQEKYIKGFNSLHDNVLQDKSEEDGWYSIRLVRNIGESYVEGKSDVLGSAYGVVNLGEIGQAWITTNLNYNPGNDYSEQYSYEYDGITTERYVLNHWNGKCWERKELDAGDEVSVSTDNNVTTYVCVIDNSGNQVLAKGVAYRNNRVVIDAGWY